MRVVRQALSPVSHKIFKAHLVGVEDDPADEDVALLQLRSVVDGTISQHPVPRGAVLVNCTESLGTAAQNKFEPIISGGGLVLAPQTACGFTGPSATFLTHAWFLDKLEPIWRKLIRVEFNPEKKYKTGIHSLYLVVFNTLRVAAGAWAP
jgi:hypothetical protein